MNDVLIVHLESLFNEHQSLQLALWQKNYLKNQFHCLGIAQPVRKRIQKDIFKQYLISCEQELKYLLLVLWHKDGREYQYVACDLAFAYKKLWSPDMLSLFEHMIRTKSWWDTVDTVSSKLIGMLVKKYPELYCRMDSFIVDENMWMRRCALLFQLSYQLNTDSKRLFLYAQQVMHEKEFFTRKALGWALRQYAKHNPLAVKNFINTHKLRLSRLTIREALRHVDKVSIQ